MHIPDGLMEPLVAIIGYLIALPVIAYAVMKVNRTIDERQIPFMAILAAGIFVAQMLNFPVGGGTSGHLIGAALATVLLGVYGAIVVMTVILVIQALVFGDGGLTALGLNLLNMAIIAPVVSYLIIRPFWKRDQRMPLAVGSWSSVLVAACVCALQLSVSYVISGGVYGIEPALAIPTMLGWHAIIGVGEAIITVGVVAFLAKVAPETMTMRLGRGMEAEPEVAS